MRLIWCQGGNRESSRLAVSAGWWYGFRSDDSHAAAELGPAALLDSHWEAGKVDWPKHLRVADRVRPWLATIPDTMTLAEVPRTLRQAEQIAPYCDKLLIVPKLEGVIDELPREIAGKPVVLGYSVPTGYGGTPVSEFAFQGWPVHLLGGSARRQAELCCYLRVISADGNIAWRLARRGIICTNRGTGGETIKQADGKRWAGDNAHLEALRRSLINLRKFWSHRKIEWREEVEGVCRSR